MELINLLWYTSIPILALTSLMLVAIVAENIQTGYNILSPKPWVLIFWILSLGLFVGGFFV